MIQSKQEQVQWMVKKNKIRNQSQKVICTYALQNNVALLWPILHVHAFVKTTYWIWLQIQSQIWTLETSFIAMF